MFAGNQAMAGQLQLQPRCDTTVLLEGPKVSPVDHTEAKKEWPRWTCHDPSQSACFCGAHSGGIAPAKKGWGLPNHVC